MEEKKDKKDLKDSQQKLEYGSFVDMRVILKNAIIMHALLKGKKVTIVSFGNSQ